MRTLCLGVWVSMTLLGCTAVVLEEERADVCANGMDDDGDGATDCEDPSCDGSGVCETTESSCGNGLDDDEDGLTDCAEEACRAGGWCDSFLADCGLLPQSGCPGGMGCYRRATGVMEPELRCRSAGVGVVGAACDITEIDRLEPSDAHPCEVGLACTSGSGSVGTCGTYCGSDDDCPTGGLCSPNPADTGVPGVCSEPCDPRVAGECAAGLRCASFHERGDTFDEGGARWACVDEVISAGTAGAGSPCSDPAPPATPAGLVCRSSLACVPDLGGGSATCRALCEVGDADPGCGAGERCERLYPMGDPSGVGNTVFGVCL